MHEHHLSYYVVPPGHPRGERRCRAHVSRLARVAAVCVIALALTAGAAVADTAGDLDPNAALTVPQIFGQLT